LWHLRRGEFAEAEKHFRKAIEQLTRRNANPYDGEPYYNLGLCLRYSGRDDAAYAAFYKATWNQAWAGAGYHALAEIDCAQKNWAASLEHLDRSLRFNTENLRARNLKVMVLRELGETTGGPPPFTKADRSRFLQALDTAVQAARRSRARRA